MENEEDSDFNLKIEESRFEIVKRLNLDRTSLLDYLRSKGIFDAGDCDLVLSEKTREHKAGKLLDILETKGNNAVLIFVDALQFQNPDLFEKITGKKANPGSLYNDMTLTLADCRYIPDVEILSGQLKQTISDFHDLAMRYHEVLKENQSLGKHLDQASTDLEAKHRRVGILEKQMIDTEAGVAEAHKNASQLSEAVTVQLRNLQQIICERNTFIIALQMKLLTAEEEAKQMRKVSEFEKQCRELQFVNQKLIAERDESGNQLNELKDWTEALKAKFDLVTDEYKQLQQSFVNAAADNCKLKENVEELKLHLSLNKIATADLKNWNDELEEGIKEYRKQRDFFSESRKEALQERDNAQKERDEAVQKYHDVIQTCDAMVTRQCEHTKHFEEKYDKALNELRPLQRKIAAAQLEIEELKSKLRVHDDREKAERMSCEHLNEVNTIKDRIDVTQLYESVSEASSPQGSPTGKLEGFSWADRRATTAIIDSVRKRVAGTQQTQVKVMSLDRALITKPDDTNPDLLQAGKMVFKSVPSYGTLQCMFGGSLGRNGLGSPAEGTTTQDTGNEHSLDSTSTNSSRNCHEEGASPRSEGSKSSGAENDCKVEEDKPEVSKPKSRPHLYSKSLSTSALLLNGNKVKHAVNDELLEEESSDLYDNDSTDIDNSFHWVRTDECGNPLVGSRSEGELRPEQGALGMTENELHAFYNNLIHKPLNFRQRAWAMKKKSTRRQSEPTIRVLHDNGTNLAKTS
ncbi:predicted protein [Nematostella vectensis]|uniref:CARD domain-containing protein n=1 Tax=Nematostella vectensis TaxID=45351 RepID=A7SMP6_NEMVE|nr:predicted protein [Nematostella vectensis]|eukprot:XP_001627124.1 predicted protein [Nematostella vectensis]